MTAHALSKYATAVAVVIAAVSARSETIVDANFDGALPTDGWDYAAGTGTPVSNDGPESDITANPGGASLRLNLNPSDAPRAYKDISVSGVDAVEPLNIEFDYNVNQAGPQEKVIVLRGGSDGIFLILDGQSGNVRYINSSNARTTIATGVVTVGEWYHVHIVAVAETNAVGDTFDLTITDTNDTALVSATGLTFRNDISDYTDLRWYHNVGSPGSGGSFYVDNVNVWTDAVAPPPIQPPVDTNITSILVENFNGTPGTLYAFEDFDGALPTNGWTFVDNGAILANNGPNAVDPFDSPGNSLNVDMTSSGVPQVDISVAPTGADTNQPVSIKFSYNPVDLGAAAHEFALRGNGDTTLGIQMDLTDGSGEVRYHDGNGFVGLGVILDEGAWYHFELLIDAESNASGDTFDLTILNTNLTAIFSTNGLAFRNDLAGYDVARFYYNTGTPVNDGQYYLDNVTIRTVADAFKNNGVVFENSTEQVGPESDFDPNVAGGMSAKLRDAEFSSNPEMDAFFTVDDPDKPLHIIFDYYPITTGAKNFGFRLRDNTQLDDTTSFDTQGMDGIRMMDTAGGNIQNKSGVTDPWVNLVSSPIVGEWSTIEIVASPESSTSKTFDIWAYDQNGALIGSATDQPFRFNITNYTSFGFFRNVQAFGAGNKGYYIDNLRIGTTAPVPVVITSIDIDGSGNVVLDFTGETSSTYSVDMTDMLATGFSGTTNSVMTDGAGVGQATVPASELSGSDEYFFGLE